MSHMVLRLTVQARLQSQTNPYGIYGEYSRTYTSLSQRHLVSPVTVISPVSHQLTT